MLWLTYIIILLFVIGLYLELKTRKAYSRFIDIRTGQPIPIAAGYFSAILAFVRTSIDICQAERVKELGLKYGPYYANYSFSPVVTFTDPEDIKTILKKIDDFPKSNNFIRSVEYTKVLIGTNNIAQVNNPEWHDQRFLLNKAFTSNGIFLQPMCNKINLCISKWENQEEVRVGNDLQKLTLDVLASCVFGFDFDTLNGKLSEPLNAYNHSLNNAFHPIRVLFPWVTKLPLSSNKKLFHELSTFDKYCWEIMDQTKKKMQEKKNQIHTDQPENGTKSLIELMYESGLPEETIRDNVSIFFIAGHETTANSLAWLLSVLVSHPEIQRKARQEIFDKVPKDFTFDSLKELPYIDALIKESLRIYPPFPIAGVRFSSKDTVIGNVQVPAGTLVQLNIIAMAHDPKIWGDPEKVRPERWFNENVTKEQRSAWMPFSTGPRVCIGMNFSLFEQKIFLIYLLKRFKEIKLAPQGQIKPKIRGIYGPDDNFILQFGK